MWTTRLVADNQPARKGRAAINGLHRPPTVPTERLGCAFERVQICTEVQLLSTVHHDAIPLPSTALWQAIARAEARPV